MANHGISWNPYYLSYRIGDCMSSLRTCVWISYLITSPMTLSRNSGGRKVNTWWFLLLTPADLKPSLWISEKHYPDFFPFLLRFDDARLGTQEDSTENDSIPPSFCSPGSPGHPVEIKGTFGRLLFRNRPDRGKGADYTHPLLSLYSTAYPVAWPPPLCTYDSC